MKRNNTLLIFLLLAFQFIFSQNEKLISGKITIKDATPKGVHIINLVNENEVVSDSNGNFSIMAKPDDVLVFSAVHLDYARMIIEHKDYDSGKIAITMTSKVTELDEVEVVNYNMNAVNMGILSKPAKQYTPAERKVFTATSTSIDALLNLISGRTAMLKNGVKTEKKEMLLQKLDGLFDDSFYKDNLNIEKEDIKGFHYFIVEDKKFASAIESKNKTLATFLMIELAVKYNNLKADGKK